MWGRTGSVLIDEPTLTLTAGARERYPSEAREPGGSPADRDEGYTPALRTVADDPSQQEEGRYQAGLIHA